MQYSLCNFAEILTSGMVIRFQFTEYIRAISVINFYFIHFLTQNDYSTSFISNFFVELAGL